MYLWTQIIIFPKLHKIPYSKSNLIFCYSGLINSRLEREWCLNVSRCIDPAFICEDMELDFMAAKKLIQERNQILYGAIFRYKPKPFAIFQ